MKSNQLTKLIITFALLILSSSCTKDSLDLDNYIGNWNFKVIVHSETTPATTEVNDTTNYLGTIIIGGSNDELIVHYSDTDSIAVHLNDDGTLSDNCFQPSSCSGCFSDYSTFNYQFGQRVNNGGSMGMLYYSLNIEGAKILD